LVYLLETYGTTPPYPSFSSFDFFVQLYNAGGYDGGWKTLYDEL
jgi:hypothetical protein